MFNYCRAAIAVLFCAVLMLTGCQSSTHPNQINTFDGSTYDTLVTSRAALVALRSDVVSKYPTYAPEFNAAARAFETTVQTYTLYRGAPTATQEQVTLEIGNLTVSVVALETSIQQALHVPPATAAKVRAQYQHKRNGLARNNITVSDILTELEIAAGIAQAIPGAQPYAGLASLVIQATQSAVAALQHAQGTPIDLQALQPIAVIGVAR